MRRIRKTIGVWAAKVLDVPQDVTMDLPRITMIGNMQLLIENYRKVLHFSDNLLRLSLSRGQLEIHGQNLTIRGIWTDEVMVEGHVTELKYIDISEGR